MALCFCCSSSHLPLGDLRGGGCPGPQGLGSLIFPCTDSRLEVSEPRLAFSEEGDQHLLPSPLPLTPPPREIFFLKGWNFLQWVEAEFMG